MRKNVLFKKKIKGKPFFISATTYLAHFANGVVWRSTDELFSSETDLDIFSQIKFTSTLSSVVGA